MESSIEQEIAKLKQNLDSLRLPHKLNKYRDYKKRIDSLQKLAKKSENFDNERFSNKLNELQDRLDKSVLCGVDECCICNSSSGATSSASFAKQNPVYNRSKSSNYVLSNRGVWNINNNHNNNQLKTNNTSFKEDLPKLKSYNYNKQISLQHNSIGGNSAAVDPADELLNSIAQIQLDEDAKVEPKPPADVDKKIIETKQTRSDTTSPSRLKISDDNTVDNNRMPDTATQLNQINKSSSLMQSTDKILINTMPRLSTGSIGTSIKLSHNPQDWQSAHMAPRLSAGSIGSPKIITNQNSYKAYKDFINNYRDKNDQLQQSHT